MRAIGRASISSLVKFMLDAAWYVTIVFGGLVVLDALVGLGGVSAGRIDLMVRFELDPATYRIVSDALGIEHAFMW